VRSKRRKSACLSDLQHDTSKSVEQIRGYTNLLTHRIPFRDLSAEDYEQRARERDLANLRKRAATLGLTLVESPA
jgi:hypothetical protein